MAKKTIKEVEVWLAEDGTECEDQFEAISHDLLQTELFTPVMYDREICDTIVMNIDKINEIIGDYREEH